MMNSDFTNGVIAVRERYLLGEKLLRFCEMTEEEFLRALKENGFGGGSFEEPEELCKAEEAALDGFIREYAPAKTELCYLLSPRDFHNAKALCKAAILSSEADKMLAPEGLVPVKDIARAINEKNYEGLPAELREPAEQALSDENNVSGAEIGAIFDGALYKYLHGVCKRNALLKKLLAGKADRQNILTYMRSADIEQAEKLFVEGGSLKKEALAALFGNADDAQKALDGMAYSAFYKTCLTAKEKGMPFTEAERALESFEAEYFVEKRFELEGKKPFLYYVFRRRAEIQNVRIIAVCLNAGLSSAEIKRRLRAV